MRRQETPEDVATGARYKALATGATTGRSLQATTGDGRRTNVCSFLLERHCFLLFWIFHEFRLCMLLLATLSLLYMKTILCRNWS